MDKMRIYKDHPIPEDFKESCFDLIVMVQEYLDKYAAIMKEPASFDRGAKIATIQNTLEFQLFYTKRNCEAWYEIDYLKWKQAQKQKDENK